MKQNLNFIEKKIDDNISIDLNESIALTVKKSNSIKTYGKDFVLDKIET